MPEETVDPGRARRRFPRIPFPTPVIVISPDQIATLPARNISACGVFVVASGPHPVGLPVTVEFQVAGREFFSLGGKVVRQDPLGFAVNFDVEDGVKQRIERARSCLNTLAASTRSVDQPHDEARAWDQRI